MIWFAASLISLIVSLFHVIGYISLCLLLKIAGFISTMDEDSFWEDEETEMLNDFRSWLYCLPCCGMFVYMSALSYFQIQTIYMNREEEMMYYVSGNGIKTLSCSVGVSGIALCLSLLFVKDYVLWSAAIVALL